MALRRPMDIAPRAMELNEGWLRPTSCGSEVVAQPDLQTGAPRHLFYSIVARAISMGFAVHRQQSFSYDYIQDREDARSWDGKHDPNVHD
eukprot:CAMPEP_0169077588 /NCGR_PEP_ID=MMETSP1015-20121227/8959_1 /TAXON_ID=342587 /ORGANISM="Karlodinium micrum, Strain CCMP2283" /LENGTH=89 /DNA_ID=CAMNT_0009137123 /DNA_START=363 /DNA_END=632 /DNA_ORIENTATION=+